MRIVVRRWRRRDGLPQRGSARRGEARRPGRLSEVLLLRPILAPGLGELCRILSDAYAVTLLGGKTGLILFVQTF